MIDAEFVGHCLHRASRWLVIGALGMTLILIVAQSARAQDLTDGDGNPTTAAAVVVRQQADMVDYLVYAGVCQTLTGNPVPLADARNFAVWEVLVPMGTDAYHASLAVDLVIHRTTPQVQAIVVEARRHDPQDAADTACHDEMEALHDDMLRNLELLRG